MYAVADQKQEAEIARLPRLRRPGLRHQNHLPYNRFDRRMPLSRCRTRNRAEDPQ